MHTQLQITLHGIEGAAALRKAIEDEMAALRKHCSRLESCRVTVERSKPGQEGAAGFQARVNVTAPGISLVVNREHGENARAAVHSAFQAAAGMLQGHIARKWG